MVSALDIGEGIRTPDRLDLVWEQFGGSEWNWKGLLPYFQKAQTFQGATVETPLGDHSAADPAYHGTKGPIQV